MGSEMCIRDRVRVGAVILDMQSGNETLEDMFLKLTSGKYDSRKEDM